MHLYLTRHGETQSNVQGRYCGSADIPLNETGIKQAHDLAFRLKDICFDAIISSPMLRARQTTEIVSATLNMQYSIYEQFAERNMGIYEGLTRNEAKEQHPDIWRRLSTGSPDEAPDGGETIREACNRIDDGMTRLLHDYRNKTVLLVCHGLTARAVNRFCLGLQFDQMHSFTLWNCEVAEYKL